MFWLRCSPPCLEETNPPSSQCRWQPCPELECSVVGDEGSWRTLAGRWVSWWWLERCCSTRGVCCFPVDYCPVCNTDFLKVLFVTSEIWNFVFKGKIWTLCASMDNIKCRVCCGEKKAPAQPHVAEDTAQPSLAQPHDAQPRPYSRIGYSRLSRRLRPVFLLHFGWLRVGSQMEREM